MKVKVSWVAFVPLTVGAILLHIYHLIFLGGEDITQPLFGEYSLLMTKKTEPEIIVLLAAVLFVFVLFFSLIDRKTAPVCEIDGSPLSGIFLILSGLLLGVESSVGLMTGAYEGSWLVQALGIAAALLFAVIGMGMLVGFNISKKIRGFMIVPTFWSAVTMVNVFISHRKEAPSFSFFDVFAWVFLTLFLFENSMVLSGIDIKNPVKSSFVYGMPCVLFSIVYVISEIRASMIENGGFQVTSLLNVLYVGTLGVYAFFILTKISSEMLTKEEAAELLEDYDSDSEDYDEDDEEAAPEAAFGVGSTKFVTAEFEKIRLEKAAKKAKERTGTLPDLTADNNDSIDDFEDDEEDEPMSTLDKIDQLIMELSDDSDDE
ncbi:MAG: hypothetical protein II685_00400 [Clostridia bacterium]|nr:hypothetical protein [Clostridia bacterium]